jgi:predicted permease
VYLQTTARWRLLSQSVFPYTRYLDLRKFATSFSEWGAFAEWRLAIGRGDATRERQVAGLSSAFFHFFDAPPALGRYFTAVEDSIPRGANVAVLSYAFWQSEYGGRNVLGEPLQVGPLPTTIIGVAPEGFVGVVEDEPPAVFVPITTLAYGVNQGNPETFPRKYNWDWMSVIARRKPGVSVATANADLTHAFALSIDAQRPEFPRTPPLTVIRPRAYAGAVKTAAGPGASLESSTLLWVGGVAAIVLLIACANVANLMLARALKRRREIAVRLALGVGRRRLAGQFFIEGLLLASFGSAAGVLVAQWLSMGLRRLFPNAGALAGTFVDWQTILLAIACALGAGLLASLAPALLSAPGDLTESLREGARAGTGSRHRNRVRATLLVAQAAMSVALLVGAGLFVRSLSKVKSQPLGWDPDPVLLVTLEFRGLQLDSAALIAVSGRLLETAQALPGVVAAARINGLPFATSTAPIFVTGIDSVQLLGRFNYQATTPDYFKAIGTRILSGRTFLPSEVGDAGRVVVVSQSMARVLWRGKDPVGQCLRILADTMPCTRVIGVAEDAVQQNITDTERLLWYTPDQVTMTRRPGHRILVRLASRDPQASVEAVRRAMDAAMPPPGYVTVSPLEDLVARQRRSWQLGATMFVAFGALALLVAAVGLYGVIGYNVEQRMQELSIRMALGAQARNIIGLVVGQGVWFAGAGIVFGVATSLLASRWVQPLLFRESARDAQVYCAVAGVIGLVALVASMAPAARASRADPAAALRSD